MTNKKYDPLIFGSILPETAPEICGGTLYVSQYMDRSPFDSSDLRVRLCCDRCHELYQMSLMSYTIARDVDLICKRELCQTK